MSKKVIIAEKPSAAKKLADALADDGKEVKKSKYGVKYYEFNRNGTKHVAAPAVGHLFNLKQKGKGWTYPVFEAEWVPSYKAQKEAAFSKKYFKTIESIASEAADYIVACDLDEEGSLIGANIVKFLFGQENAKRMKFSTLTAADLIEAYNHMSPNLDFSLIEAGETRHHLDWLYGVNITRALTLALNRNAKLGFQVISAGRVQTPTLTLLLQKEQEIRRFEPTPYWQIEAEVRVDGEKVTALHVKGKFWKEDAAQQILQKCRTKTPEVVNLSRRKYKQKPPTPFNLTDLQTEAYRFFKYTPDRTLDIAENLYTRGYISYPRTSSQKLPPKINYRRILKALSNLKPYEKLTKTLLEKENLQPREGKKTDPAHLAIYCTHEPPKKVLKGPQRKIYDLIVRRFLATFAKPAIRESLTVTIGLNDEEFETKGRRTIKRNWHVFYGPYAKFKEKRLPDLSEGQKLQLEALSLLFKETQPPPRYSPASLVKIMEEKRLGTRATRSRIVSLLFDRGYLRGKSIEVTKLGEAVVELLKENCPKITSIKLTREFEEKIERIREGKLEKETLIEEAKQVLRPILQEFKEKEVEIGKKLTASFKKAQKADSYLGECPQCGNDLRIIYSKKTHKRFVGCTGYFKGECDFSAPLPQKGKIQPIKTKCKYCGYPMVMVLK
ncbi:MAG: DNA topoisomerase I, partial [Candidatus Korarchaeota archaeon]|nr:DNA topoisomerase I [Candidatus Korarchaeota archaeon]NIU82572.1 DNA topoisomerase I [Candidatus Thorarchaeota archaeon]NIW13062.1 DNA topoisomerase I [Candidatus Thorarchaeota archaeon]NIW53362.1 DNA topoisomerase I [Candidatus Korarchaeota archaeon]